MLPKIEYPKALYHATEPCRLVADPVEHAALGADWFEEPVPAPAADVAPAAEPPADPPPATTDAPAADGAAFDALAAEIVALTAKDAIDLLASIEQPDALAAIKAAEQAGQARKTVLAALEARVEALA